MKRLPGRGYVPEILPHLSSYFRNMNKSAGIGVGLRETYNASMSNQPIPLTGFQNLDHVIEPPQTAKTLDDTETNIIFLMNCEGSSAIVHRFRRDPNGGSGKKQSPEIARRLHRTRPWQKWRQNCFGEWLISSFAKAALQQGGATLRQ